MSYNPKFYGVSNIGEHLIMSQIENNMKDFLDWGFLNIGAYINVNRNQNNIFNNNLSILKPTEDPNYANGRVWQTMRKDWVWEDGISITKCIEPSPQTSPCPSEYVQTSEPNLISGIYINNTYYPTSTTGQYSYIVDYINSRIIFNNPQSLSSTIEMEYAYRWIQVYKYDSAKWWQQLQYKTEDNIAHFNQLNKGDFSILSNNRIQLPAVIIETISRGTSNPYQLGNKSLVMKQELMLHIVAERMSDRNMIIDILRLQQDKLLIMYDTNKILSNNVQYFNINGSLNSNRLQYNDLVTNENYAWLTCKLADIYASEVESFSPFFSESNVRISVELIFGANN